MVNQSEALFTTARGIMPGGVNSPVRAFNGVGGIPVFIQRAKGAYLFDVDGKQYIDYVGSWGPMILGHNHPAILHAVTTAIQSGLSFGAPTRKEIELTQLITTLMPSIQMVRMVNSGTEATMSAIRLARGVTGRDKIIKFEGCYHGHADYLLVKAGSGALTLGHPTSPGVPLDFTRHTLVCDFNNLDSVANTFANYKNQIAAVIVEPVAGNMNCVPATPAFLHGLQELCTKYGALLIADEVMTGFRVALGGAQAYYGMTPDLTCLGKIVGGGMPVGAFGGKREIMEQLAPTGPIYQAGTLSGNPITMAAGYACLKELCHPHIYSDLDNLTRQLTTGLLQKARQYRVPLVVNQIGGMFGIFFTSAAEVTSYSDVLVNDVELFKKFFHHMLSNGIYFAPSAFESGFMSLAHTEADIERTINTAAHFFKNL